MKNWLESIYSDSNTVFVSNPCPKKGETVKIQLRMIKNDEVCAVVLRYKCFGSEDFIKMTVSETKNDLIYYEGQVTVLENLFYQFYITTKDKIYYYTQGGITDFMPNEGTDFMIPVNYEEPVWVKNAVFYQIFPDRFCNGKPELDVKADEYTYQGDYPRPVKSWDEPSKPYEQGKNMDFHNGDLYGIIEKLDYLQDLGIDAIYLNPSFISPSDHKYDSIDYYHIDPHLGGDKGFEQLMKELHKRNMYLMLDISINHTSSDSLWFKAAKENPDSKERKFYFFNKDGSYDAWWNIPTMPKLNYTSEELKNEIYKNSDSVLKKWIHKPYQIDGWRFDVADVLGRNKIADVHSDVVKELHKELKATKNDIYLIAEDWGDCSIDLQGDKFDSTMNYFGFTRPVRQFLGEPDLFNIRNPDLQGRSTKINAEQLASRIHCFNSRLPSVIQNQLFNLLDSHDVPRLYNNPEVNPKDYLGAVILLFTLPGVPSVYYGDEIGLDGFLFPIEGCRYPFNWNWEKDPKAVEMHNFYKKVIALRKASEALKQGGYKVISTDKAFTYARFTKNETIFVIASTENSSCNVEIPLNFFGIKDFSCKTDCFGNSLSYKITDSVLNLEVSSHGSYVIKVNY